MATTEEPTSQAIHDALETLGLGPEAAWAEIRDAYRLRVRTSHPDVEPADDRATVRTAALNVAFETLAAATGRGARPLPPPPPVEPIAAPPATPAVTLRAQPGDVYVQLLEAAHEIGEVSYLDPEAGLIQVLLGAGPAASQLLIAVDQQAEPPTASFTLDSPDGDAAPSIRAIVDDLAAALHP